VKRIAALLLIALPSFAGIPYASLTGRVTSGDRPVSGASVSATCDSLPRALATSTNSEGAYWLPAIPAGRCDVTFAHAGMQTLTRRAELHAGELARVDAALEASEDEESVTSTALERSLFERPIAIWSLEQETADQLPMERGALGTLRIAPLLGTRFGRIDGVATLGLEQFEIGDAIRETAVVEAIGGDMFLTTRTANELHSSLRATYAEDDDVLVEATAGGPLGGALQLFAAGANHSAYGKVAGAIGSRAFAIGSILHTRDEDAASVDALVILNDGMHATASIASHDVASLRGYALAGDHELSFGGAREFGEDAFHLADRWTISSRWIADASLRHDERDGWTSRAGAVFDLGGDGRKRIAASVTASDGNDAFELWYGHRLEANGYARAGIIRDGEDSTAFALDAAFRFLVLTFGANATIFEHDADRANLWVLFDAPLLDRDFGVGLIGRYLGGNTTLDAAVSVSFTAGRFTPFAKGEVLDVFDAREGRSWRVGVGARL
jgi:hypothetical protein